MSLKPYEPDSLPIPNLDAPRLISVVGAANAALGQYDGLLQALVNPDILLSPLTNQEAVLSSKIEGTQATLEEVLEHEAGQEYSQEKTHDIQEILNYRTALRLARDEVSDRPLRLGMILQHHRILMSSVRGQDKTPGEFRKEQNWIGPPGCAITQATFVPPEPLRLRDHLDAWEKYVNDSDVDVLIQAAIVHGQFELIHPFKDGNGRIGRLLIPLFLFAKQALASPMFYLSEYLEENRDQYYGRLRAISQEQDWTGWIEFFLRAITEQARTNIGRVQRIRLLYDEMKTTVREVTRSLHTSQILDCLFDRPIFRVTNLVAYQIPKPTAHLILRQLEQAGVLRTLRPGAGRRPAIYVFPRLLELAEQNN